MILQNVYLYVSNISVKSLNVFRVFIVTVLMLLTLNAQSLAAHVRVVIDISRSENVCFGKGKSYSLLAFIYRAHRLQNTNWQF